MIKKYKIEQLNTWQLFILSQFIFFLLFQTQTGFCLNINDNPMETRVLPSPSNIMFIIDDSMSMDSEFIAPAREGTFAIEKENGRFNYYYNLFPNPGDNKFYTLPNLSDSITDPTKNYWQTQWSGYNKIYYDPHYVYKPWPSTSKYTFKDADLKKPFSNPIKTDNGDPSITLKDTFLNIYTSEPIIVDNADNSPAYTESPDTWSKSDSQDAWPYSKDAPDSRQTSTLGDQAVFKPDLPSAGKYRVYAWWNCYHNRDDNAKITINHAGGATELYKNQRSYYYGNNEAGICGEWIMLGNFNFNAGDTGSVTIERHAGSTGDSTVADAVLFTPLNPAADKVIKNAHYYTWYDENKNNAVDNLEIYLVTWDDTDSDDLLDTRRYFQVNDVDGDNRVEPSELLFISSNESNQESDLVPNDIQPRIYNKDSNEYIYKSDEEDLQNFANWYSYYRRRNHTAVAAMAQSITDIDWAYVGIMSINMSINQPVLPINAEDSNGVIVDDTDKLLNKLYENETIGSTPLRQALLNTGRYFDQDDGMEYEFAKGYKYDKNTIPNVQSPYKSEADGGACQRAFAILMTDGYYNGYIPVPPEKEENAVGNVDGNMPAPYGDQYSNTLADIAMKYYDTDLSASLPNILPTNQYDTKNTQHMVTYTISFGLNGTIDQNDIDNDGKPDNPSYEDDPYFFNDDTPRPVWPDPNPNISPSKPKGTLALYEKIDDLWHAAVNGGGEFFKADNSEELVDALNSIFKNLNARTASGASVATNGDKLTTDSVVYQGTYISGTWEGDLSAYPIDKHKGEILKEEKWKASETLANLSWDDRNIVTYNGFNKVKTFRYFELTPLQKSALNDNTDMVDYIRGKKVSGMRSRKSKLGDIVHSAPLRVIGDGIDNNNDGYIDEANEETGLVFVGANDGMLHAFDAKTGEEVFAYIPHIVFDHLKDLTAISYDHKFYVDGTLFSRKVTENNNDRVLLAGGLKKGGKGYFCLDITKVLYRDDGDFNETVLSSPGLGHTNSMDVMWEYPQLKSQGDVFASDDDLGYSFSDIFIVESYDDTLLVNKSKPEQHNWVAIFGNGYDSVNGSAVLYVLNAYTGEIIKKIDTGVTGDNGLSTPALIDSNNDGKVDYVYAGDLKGNMWKFDLTDADPTKWKVAYSDANGNPAPLFSSPDQPITTAPDVMQHSIVNRGYMVLFGTGKFIEDSDWTDKTMQSIYGIWDAGMPLGEWDESTGILSKIADVTLLEQTEVDYQILYNTDLRTLSDNEADWVAFNDNDVVKSGKHMGWYFDLDQYNDSIPDGERMIKDVMIRDKKLIVLTYTPNPIPCENGGTSMIHEIDASDGSRLYRPMFDINDDGVINSQDLIEITITNPDGSTSRIRVPPTGISKGVGMYHSPVIMTMPNSQEEMKIISKSDGTTERIIEPAEGGFYYWRELKDNE